VICCWFGRLLAAGKSVSERFAAVPYDSVNFTASRSQSMMSAFADGGQRRDFIACLARQSENLCRTVRNHVRAGLMVTARCSGRAFQRRRLCCLLLVLLRVLLVAVGSCLSDLLIGLWLLAAGSRVLRCCTNLACNIHQRRWTLCLQEGDSPILLSFLRVLLWLLALACLFC
jgi:hypothetical protein